MPLPKLSQNREEFVEIKELQFFTQLTSKNYTIYVLLPERLYVVNCQKGEKFP